MTRLKVRKSERGVWEIDVDEESNLGQIRTLLECNGARVFRAIERVPKCYRCGLWLGASEPGTPDISGYLRTEPLLPFWFEIKRPKGGRARQAQLARIELLRNDGACAAVVRNWAEVEAEFLRFCITFKVR